LSDPAGGVATRTRGVGGGGSGIGAVEVGRGAAFDDRPVPAGDAVTPQVVVVRGAAVGGAAEEPEEAGGGPTGGTLAGTGSVAGVIRSAIDACRA
jgi:hypothetical protein